MSAEKTKKILAWLNQDDKDYSQGVELLQLATSPATANRFRRGNPSLLLPHHVAFLRRIAGETGASPVKRDSGASPVKRDSGVSPVKRNTGASPVNPIPEPIRRAKDKLHDLWLRLVDFHQRLLDLGFDNSDEKKKARVALMADRAPFIDAFEQLYLLKEEFFAYPEGSRQLPPDLIPLLDRLDGKPTSETDSQPAKSSTSNLNSQFSNLTPLELYKKRHAILMAITRRNNKLRFSQPTPSEHLNPMPDSPKRKAIESEIATLQQQLSEIDNLLKK